MRKRSYDENNSCSSFISHYDDFQMYINTISKSPVQRLEMSVKPYNRTVVDL